MTQIPQTPQTHGPARTLGLALVCSKSLDSCAAFWGLLHIYACLDLPPKDWASLPLQHPFLCRSVDGRVRFVPPHDLDFD
jgi:hypothetical protein